MLVVSPSASANRVFEIGSNTYSIVYSNVAQATTLLQTARERYHPKKVHVVEMTDCAYCVWILPTSFVEQTKGTPLIVERDEVLETTKDYSDLAKKIVGDGTDLIFLPAYEVNAARFVQQALDAGYKGAFIGGDGWYNAEGAGLLAVVTDRPVKAFFIGHWDPRHGFADQSAFHDRTQEAIFASTRRRLGIGFRRFLVRFGERVESEKNGSGGNRESGLGNHVV